MKYKIVKSSELTTCWSPLRVTGDCHKCLRVIAESKKGFKGGGCKLPEAKEARRILARERIGRAKDELVKAEKILEDLS
ncbi:unnamed protein product [marine sediment metagenome]|uniref:Uncharacterized protein n=1 Tax=marine sediment metagenome TaxID=412755 RepID=X0XYP3_9ZZZZ